MHYALHILQLCCTLWLSVCGVASTAKAPHDHELLLKFARSVQSVLSPSLVEELEGAQTNRSAVNVALTTPRDPQSSPGINGKKPDIQFDNRIEPYHYERSYHYSYPQNPPSGPNQFAGDFYESRFRPNDYQDPRYYNSELYNPYTSSSASKSDATNDNYDNRNTKVKDPESQTPGSKSPTYLPPNAYVHPELLAPVQRPDQFVDFERFRQNVLSRTLPAEPRNYFRPPGSPPPFANDPRGFYGPGNEGKPSDGTRNGPDGSYHNFPPPSNSFHNLQPLFPGSFQRQDYQNPFYNNFRPSEHFNNLFSDNFTNGFPQRPAFGGFYPSHNSYLPPLPSPEQPLERQGMMESSTPDGPRKQLVPTAKPEESTPASASSSKYEVKLFLPAKDKEDYMFKPLSFKQFTFTTKNFRA